MLVRLHAGNFQFEGAKEDGTDIRFVAADDKTPLKFQIEKFDSLLGEAFFWVNVPDLKPGAKTEIWLYYGNSKSPGADPKGTFDADHVLVYHFAERGSPPADSSTWANHAQAAGQPAASSIDRSGPASGRQVAARAAGLAVARLRRGRRADLVGLDQHGGGAAAGRDLWPARGRQQPLSSVSTTACRSSKSPSAAGTARSEPGTAVAPGTWHHFAVVAEGGQITLYLDGAPYGTFAASLPAFSGAALLGGVPAEGAALRPTVRPRATAPPDSPATSTNWKSPRSRGPRASSKPLPSARARIRRSSSPTARTKRTSSWFGGGGYFGVILQSVTVDGWVVIVLLMIMAAISWVVMVRKAAFLNRQTKANAEFMQRFRALGRRSAGARFRRRRQGDGRSGGNGSLNAKA